MDIRPELMQEFNADARVLFHRRLAEEFRMKIPKAVEKYDEASLMATIETSHRNASSYGIHTERGLRQFITTSVIGGVDFHRQPKVNFYLRQTGMTGDQKMQLLSNFLENEARRSPEWRS